MCSFTIESFYDLQKYNYLYDFYTNMLSICSYTILYKYKYDCINKVFIINFAYIHIVSINLFISYIFITHNMDLSVCIIVK